MTTITNRKLNLNITLAASLFFHMAAFGAIIALPSRTLHSTITEYIPVELVQLPPSPRYIAAVPAVPAAAPKSPKPEPAKSVQEKTSPAPAPPAQKAVALPQPAAAITAGSTLPPHAAAAPAKASSGKGEQGNSGGAASSPAPGTGASPSGKRARGDYLAFHRLSRLPSFRVRSEPVYPDAERMTGSEARVQAEIYLDERGTVDDVAIRKSGGRLFDKAVIDAVRKSSFHPGYMGEKAVPTVIQIPYTFKLK